MNGINSIFTQTKILSIKIKKLVLNLNTEGFRKIFIDPLVIKSNRLLERKTSSYIGICLKFDTKSNYYIKLTSIVFNPARKAFKFFVNVENDNDEECVSCTFTEGKLILGD